MRKRNEGWVNARGHGFLSGLVLEAFADGQQLDRGIHCLGRVDVIDRDLTDAFGVNIVAGHTSMEGDGSQDCCLTGGIEAVHVGGRIRFCIAQLRSLGEHLLIGGATVVHRIQDEVGGSVDDAHHGIHLVASQRTTQRTDQWDRRGHSSFEEQIYSRLVRSSGELVCVGCNERLVRGHYGLTGLQCGKHDLTWVINATDDFNNQINVIALCQAQGIVSEQIRRNAWTRLVDIAYGHAANFQTTANAGGELIAALFDQTHDFRADSAQTQQCNTNGGARALAWAERIGRRISHVSSPFSLRVC